MSVVNGSPVDATNTNAAYLSKLTDGDTAGKIGFKNTDAISGAGINNIQRYVNEMADASGVSGEGDATRKQYGSTNFVADGDSRKAAIGKLDVQMKITDDLAITNQDDIVILDARVDQNEIDIQAIEDDYGVANGLATLDGTAKIPVAQIPDAALGGPRFVGTWNASTNTPTLSDGGATTSPDQGDYYRVSVAGTTTIDGENDWGQGDWIVFNGTAWDKIDNSESVSSVNSQTGVVSLDADDIAESATRFWSVKDNRSATTDPAATDDETDSYSIGSFWFNSSSGTLFVCQDATATSAIWVIATGGGGGGLSVFHTQTYEATKAADISSGNDSTFGGTTSTLQGALSDNETTPINGDRSLRFTHASTSQNDWFYADKDAITIYPKQQGRLAKVTIWANWTGADGENVFYLEDDSNTKLSSDTWTIKSGLNKHEFFFTVPSGAVSLRAGIHVITANDTETLDIDDIEFDLNTHSEEAIKDIQEYKIAQPTNALTNRTDEIEFNLGTATITESGEALIVAEDDSANTRTKFVAKRKCVINIHFSSQIPLNGPLAITKNGIIHQVGSGAYTDTAVNFVSTSIELDADDYFTVAVSSNSKTLTGATIPSGTTTADVSFVAEALSDHVVTPARSNMLDYTEYTPTTQGFGTPTNVQFYYKQFGDSFHIVGSLTSGTPTAIEAQIGLPSGFSVKTGVDITIVGIAGNGASSAETHVMANGGDTFLNFANGGYQVPEGGSTVASSGFGFSFSATVPIEGLSSEAQFLAAIPKPLTAYIEHRENNNVAGGTYTSGSWQTRPLTEVHPESDSGIVTLSLNEFTLGQGKYEIEYWGQCYAIGQNKVRLYNVTDSAATDILGSGGAASAVGMVQSFSGKLNISSLKTYRVEVRGSVTRSTQGLGFPTNFGEDEIYAQLKITKLY